MLKARKGLVMLLHPTQSMIQCMMHMRRLGWDKGLILLLCRSRLLIEVEEAIKLEARRVRRQRLQLLPDMTRTR